MPILEEFRDYAARLGFPDSETMGQILSLLFPEGISRQLFKALTPTATVEEMAARTGLPREQVAEAAEHLVRIGAIGRNMEQRDQFKRFGAMIEMRDATVIYPQASAELFHLWERLITEELHGVIPRWREAGLPPLLRVVPVEETVPSQSLILDIDSARKILREAELITAIPCPCRLQARQVGKGKDCPAPKEFDLCLQINKFAQHSMERGVGERISQQEALRRIGLAEDAGLVHHVRNNVKKDMLMCNCCACCCTGLFMIEKLNYAAYAKSRFQVAFDPGACNGCGKCVKRCQFKAVTVDKGRPKGERSAEFNFDKCYGCGNCVAACPTKALSLQEVRPRGYVRNT
jgi:NAD-dependent dihydropyrimidine dehydrogenase PreA subunit